MKYLQENIEYLLKQKGLDLVSFLKEHSTTSAETLSLSVLAAFARENDTSLENLLFYRLQCERSKLSKIKFLILDVDGVMTDGGMYFTENGDQFKRYNTKDGMGIMALHKTGMQTGIISSGFKAEMVIARAELLKISKVYVGRAPKLEILAEWMKELNLSYEEIAMIGDDINDIGIMEKVGFTATPADAVPNVKSIVDVVLRNRGGEGCVRELIDNYLLEQPLK